MTNTLSQLYLWGKRSLQWWLGSLALDLSEDERYEEMRRIFFTSACLLALLVLLILAFQAPEASFAPQQLPYWLGMLLSLAGFLLVRRGYYKKFMARVVFGYYFLLTVVFVYLGGDADNLLYLLLAPPIFNFFFGRGEGLLWSLTLLALAWPVLSVSFAQQFVFTYLGVISLSLFMNRLRVRAEFKSEQRRRRVEGEHERLLDMQKELAASEARFRTYTELASDWLFEMNKDLTYTFATPRLREILGGSVEGQRMEDLRLELRGDGKALAPMMRGEEITNMNVSFKNFRGEPVTALFSAKPLFDEHGEFAGYIGAGKDITDIKQAEEELRLKDQTLYHMQKLEALGQLTSGVAHDFNNLLTIIGGNLDLMLHDKLDEKDIHMLMTSMQAVDRAGELTQQLLSFSRKQELDPRPVHAAVVFERLTQMFDRTTEASIHLKVMVEQGLWSCLADEGQLENAVLNLALNARDAMLGRGQIYLSASNYSHSGSRTGADDTLPPGDYVRISVQDFGSGIDEAEISRITEPFYTTKPVGEGTGLGLSMVYGFARQSGGDLQVVSEPGVGSTFTIVLPRSEAEVAAIPEHQQEGDNLRGNVMVIDDDADVLNVIRLGLEKMGLMVVVFSSAEQALLAIDVLKPHLIISDLMLGDGINGAEFGERVKASHPDIPFLLISGNPDQLLSDAKYRHLSASLLRKPFSYLKLREAVQARLPS